MPFKKPKNQNRISAAENKERLPSYDEIMLEDIEKTYKKISWIQTNLESNEGDLEERVNGKEITVFMGNARVGKSTIIKYLSGSNLQSVYWHKNKILESSSAAGLFGSSLPKSAKLVLYEEDTDIGHGTKPHTSTPRAFSVQEDLELASEIIWDIPGFGDTGGVAQDIYNSICIQKILKNAKSVKFVLVSSVREIEGPGAKQFYDLLSVVSRMFDEASSIDIAKNFGIVFTMGDSMQHDREYITEILAENVKSLELNQFMEALVNHFIEHQENIGFFHSVRFEGKYSVHGGGMKILGHSQMLESINSIEACSQDVLKTIGSCASSSTEFFLLKEFSRIREIGIFKHLTPYYDIDLMEQEESFDMLVDEADPEKWLRTKKMDVLDLEEKLSNVKEGLKSGDTLSEVVKILFPEDKATQEIVSKVGAIVDLAPSISDLNQVFKNQLRSVIKTIEHKIKRYHAKLDLVQTEIFIDKYSTKQATLDIKHEAIRTKLLECQDKIESQTNKKEGIVFDLKLKQTQYGDLNQSYTQQIKNLGYKESEYQERQNDLTTAQDKEAVEMQKFEEAEKEENKHQPFREGVGGGTSLGLIGSVVGGIVGGGIGLGVAVYTGGQAAPLIMNFAQNGAQIGGMIGGMGGGSIVYLGARRALQEAKEKVIKARVALQQSEDERVQVQRECEVLRKNLDVLTLELDAIKELYEECEQALEQERRVYEQLEQCLEKTEKERKSIDLSNEEAIKQKNENSLILKKALEKAKNLKAFITSSTEVDYSDDSTNNSNKSRAHDELIDSRMLVSLADLHEENMVAFLTLDGNNHDLVREALLEDNILLNTRVFAINVSGNGQPRNAEGGTHWVAYVEIKNQDGSMSGFVLNSSEEKYYSQATEELNIVINDSYHILGQEISLLPTMHLDLQRDGKPSCGIWVLEFLEAIRQTENIPHKTALEIYQSIGEHCRGIKDPCTYIEAKRKEYDVLLEALDKSTHSTTTDDSMEDPGLTIVAPLNVIKEDDKTEGDFVSIYEEDYAHMDHDAGALPSEPLSGPAPDLEGIGLLGNM